MILTPSSTLVVLAFCTLAPRVWSMATFGMDCTKATDTCNNACWAVNSGYAPGQLTYDSDTSKRSPRRTASGCNKSPCSAKAGLPYRNFATGPNPSCDEYPFASTTQGGTGAILRCAARSSQSSEGGQLSAFYKTINSGDTFQVAVVNYLNQPLCANARAANDGGEFHLVSGNFKTARRDLDDEEDFEELASNSTQRVFGKAFIDEEGNDVLILASDMSNVEVGHSYFLEDRHLQLVERA